MPRILLFLLLSALVTACAPQPWIHKDARDWAAEAPPTDRPYHQLFLIGDCGKPASQPGEASLRLLRQAVDTAGANGTVVFLGDNIYDRGLGPEDHADRKEMERRIMAQVDAAENSGGKVYFIPGNHDWDNGGEHGLEYIRLEEAYVERELGSADAFRPGEGCPGPSVIRFAPQAALVVMDSQWWLHPHEKPGKEAGCTADTEAEYLSVLRDTLEALEEPHIFLAMHHPVYTYGTHGGHYGIKFHIFPLIMANKKLFIPLPVLGSLAVGFRSLIGAVQDCAHPRNRRLRHGLRDILHDFPNVVHVAGHEHSLQYIHDGHNHYIVSGAGSKVQAVGHGKYARYTNAQKGFARVDFYPNGEMWLSFLVPGKEGGEVVYRTQLGMP